MNVKAKICYKCNEYIILHPDNPVSQKIEQEFTFKHRGHPTQVVNLEEAESFYKFEEKYRSK